MSIYWPILLIVAANTGYHIMAKATNGEVNPFASLTVTYLVSAALAAALFFVTSPTRSVARELGQMNWATYALGVAVVGLEAGSLLMYRAGWNISMGSTVANIMLALVLLAVGALAYGETVTLRQIAGVALCLGGLFLLRR